MSDGVVASAWARGHFGDQAERVIKGVVAALARAQQSAWRVQETAVSEGVENRRPYGSMWDTRYRFLGDELQHLDGFEQYHPYGASYHLVVLNGRVLIPFRHASTLEMPISGAKLNNEVPRKVSREFGVLPSPTLFDEPEDEPAGESTVGEAMAAVTDGPMPIIYIAYVANAGSDRLLAAWWGEATSLEEDGRLNWSPEQLPIESVDYGRLAVAGMPSGATGFDQGDEPKLDLSPRPNDVEVPSAEIEPEQPPAQDGDE
ncbi:hypothetical protein ACFQ1S_01665 [Kibdelosporangium lantanae]|uniref:Uncharacterized protein n=1 Tax=Kibdelosporangium lantanae TaxID=1497396 RepID=A0ABW3M146_9PSEU